MNDAKNIPPVEPSKSKDTVLNLDLPEPNTHLYQFLNDNNYQIQVNALTENNPFLEGKGFVLTDKPLLVVTVKKKENT